MEKFTTLTAVAAYYPRANVDTDLIIRVERCAKVEKDGLGAYAFEMARFLPDGKDNPAFPLNQGPFREAKILVGGINFGCGSSREMAVWALQERGYACIIAPSFGDIFFNNCLQNGVLAIRLPAATVERIASRVAGGGADATLTVDLERLEIRHAGEVIGFEVDPLARQSLLQGLDPIAVTLQREPDIAAFQARDRVERPWIYG